MLRHHPDSLGHYAATPGVGMRPITDLASPRVTMETVQTDRTQAPVVLRVSHAPGDADSSRGQLANRLQVGESVVCLVRPWHRDQPMRGMRIRAGFDDAVDIRGTEGSKPDPGPLQLNRLQPWLRHPRIFSGQGGNPAVKQLTSVCQQAPHGAVEDETDIRRDTPRCPVADHRAPANDLESGNLEPVIAACPSLLLSTAVGAITGFSAPTMPRRDSFTRLAEVSGDADCDRSLSPCSDD